MRKWSRLGSVLAVIAIATAGCAQTDAGLTTSVKARLAADDTVKAHEIDVDAEGRVVTLSGPVGSEAVRARAVQIARATDGVDNVVDNMVVTPGAAPTTGVDDTPRDPDAGDAARDATGEAREAGREAGAAAREAGRDAGDMAGRAGAAVTDAALTTAVKGRLVADSDVPGTSIDVDTSDGVVTLTGSVRSAAEKQRAVLLARETSGVKSVVDRLKVR